jgi:cysteine synthase A
MYPVDHVASSILEAVGDTPIVELSRLARGLEGRLLAKCEYLNPSGSKKDLIACFIIEDAEKQGLLRPGQTVVEITSGNTGNGLAMVCAIKGYPFIAVMSKGNSPERVLMSRAMGAEVVLVDQAPGSEPGRVSGADLHRVEDTAQRIVRERDAFLADQFNRESNFRAHFLFTGPDIIRKTGGAIDAFCDLVGTGGSFAGCAAALKEHNPAIRCYVVEPEGMEVLAGCLVTCSRHVLQGAGYARKELKLVHREHIDGFVGISDADATEMTRRLARVEGIFAGYTAGANVAAGLRLLKGELAGKTVVVSIPDSGMKYFSTGLWGQPC